MGGGQLLPMTSTRKQDYGQARYQLAAAFPAFIRSAPQRAIDALNAALEAHVAREHRESDAHELEFDAGGVPARISLDRSYIWDAGRTRHGDHPLEMLDTLVSRLGELAKEGDDAALDAIIPHFLRTVRLAVFWRRLLDVAARYPNTSASG
jgi:hypothetical protein